MALLRPSELARLWELHPKTVYQWIREGRLPSIKTPGAQYRVRSDDVRAFCEENSLAMPRAVANPEGRIAILGAPSPSQRSIVRTCRARGTSVELWPRLLKGLMGVAADPPDIVVLDASCTDLPAADAIRAIRETPRTATLAIVAYNAPARASTLTRLGAVVFGPDAHNDDVASAILDGLEAAMHR